LAADLGEPPAEIFGSTETGGVAWRQQTEDGAFTPWETLPGVSVGRDDESGQLVVTSPFVNAGGPPPRPDGSRLRQEFRQEFRMADRCTLLESRRFLLQGRADRVVKVGEKRLALPEMEDRLCEHPWVEEVALLLIEQAGESRVAAVVVATAAGDEVLVRDGRRVIARVLGEHLAQWWDRVLLPRAWRFVPELPRDTRGKTPLAILRGLFDVSSDRRPRDPALLEERREVGSIERLLVIPADLAQLEGHFEGFPIVAGVVQLGWAMEAVTALLGEPPRICAMEALKFHQVLRPGERVWVRVELSPDRNRVYFRLSKGHRLFASGRCILEASV
jgi:3-hydroxymyristoyl/3-hydroxydecanoyl-(acyl carrier protein) dehydratase